MDIQSLDDTALQSIIEKMPIPSILALCSSNKNFKRICDDPNSLLWILLMQRDFPHYLMDGMYASHKTQWKDLSHKRAYALSVLSKHDKGMINLPKSCMYGVNFGLSGIRSPSHLTSSNFKGSDLSYATFHPLPEEITQRDTSLNMCRVNFNGSKLNHTTFKNVDLMDAMFINTTLISAKFIDCEYIGTLFTDTNLENATFTGSIIELAHFTDTNLSNVKFMIQDFFMKTTMSNSILKGINFNTSFDSCSFEYSTLSNVNFQKVDIKNTSFRNAICLYTNFTKSTIVHCSFENTTLTNCDFTDATIRESNFTTSILLGTQGI